MGKSIVILALGAVALAMPYLTTGAVIADRVAIRASDPNPPAQRVNLIAYADMPNPDCLTGAEGDTLEWKGCKASVRNRASICVVYVHVKLSPRGNLTNHKMKTLVWGFSTQLNTL